MSRVSGGWREVLLGEVTLIQQGSRVEHLPTGAASVPVLGATGVVGSWHESTYDGAAVALGCRGTVGTVRLIDEPAWFSNNVMALRPTNPSELEVRFLALALEHVDLLGQGAIGGQVQKQITRKSLAPVRVALPSLDEQRRLVDLIGTLDRVIALHAVLNGRAAGGHLHQLRSNLLTALLSGEHPIPETYDEMMECSA